MASKVLTALLGAIAATLPSEIMGPNSEELDKKIFDKMLEGEYYVDWDEVSASWCVFHTETDGHAYESCADVEVAEGFANSKNKTLASLRKKK